MDRDFTSRTCNLNLSSSMANTSSSNEARTLVLVGRTGNGKSAIGNSVLGRRAFKSKSSSSGITRVCELQRTIIKDGPIVNVIDTPGLFDGTHSAGKEIVKCLDMAKDGIHAVLMVFSVKTRFSEEEQATFLALQALFGHKIVDYMIVVFTGGDELEENEETLDDYLGHECPQPLKDIMILCDNRKLLFDNKTKDKEKQSRQVQQLLTLVNTVISQNGGQPFTNELFIELKEKATMRDNQQKTVDSLKGYSKEEMFAIKMHMQQKYDHELQRMTNMVESKLKEETANLLKKLEEERVARLNDEIQRLKRDLEEEKRRRDSGLRIPLSFPLIPPRQMPPPCPIL